MTYLNELMADFYAADVLLDYCLENNLPVITGINLPFHMTSHKSSKSSDGGSETTCLGFGSISANGSVCSRVSADNLMSYFSTVPKNRSPWHQASSAGYKNSVFSVSGR